MEAATNFDYRVSPLKPNRGRLPEDGIPREVRLARNRDVEGPAYWLVTGYEADQWTIQSFRDSIKVDHRQGILLALPEPDVVTRPRIVALIAVLEIRRVTAYLIVVAGSTSLPGN